MQVMKICGWHKFFIICIVFLMAAQMLNSATNTLVADYDIGPASNWMFILKWLLAVPSAQPKLAAKFDIGW